MRIVAIALCLAVSMACARNAPPTLTPAGIRLYQANEVVVALGTLQTAAIQLNAVQSCQAPPNETVCAPLVSDRNTGIVVDYVGAALTTIRLVPDGWRATAGAALTEIATRLDAAGSIKLSAYIQAVRTILAAL